MNPKVSAIIPLYNAEQYIGACIQSILSQTMKEIEVIVVNDCSTDGSEAVVRDMMDKDDSGRIRLITLEKNSRAGIARNTGLKQAKGDYVIFIDSDDEVTSDMFEAMYSQAVADGSDVCLCDAAKVFPDGKERTISHVDGIDGEVDTEKRKFLLTSYITTMWMLSRRSFLLDNDIYFTPEKYEDSFFVPLVYLYVSKVSYVRKPFYRYFVRTTSISHTTDDTKYTQKVSLFDNLFRVVRERSLYEPYKDELDYVYLKKAYLVPTFNYLLNSTRPSRATIRAIRSHMEEMIPGGTDNPYFKKDTRARLMDWLLRHAPGLSRSVVRGYSKMKSDQF